MNLSATMPDPSAIRRPSIARPSRRDWPRSIFPIAAALLLLTMGLANIAQRATSEDVEDGVLWVERSAGVVAAEVADASAADRAGIKAGDVLLSIDGAAVTGHADVLAVQLRAQAGDKHRYTLLREGSRAVADLALEPLPSGANGLYYVLAAVGIFTLLVGAAVRTRRPLDQATLHFFWLAVAFFGAFTFSFTGRFDRVDWFFYWADAVALALLPPLFLHFALVFPERPHSDGYTAKLARWLPTIYLPAAVLASTRILALLRAGVDPAYFVRLIEFLDTLEIVHLAAFLGAGLAVLVRALYRVRSVTSTRQLRWIVWGTALGALPFAVGYAIPFALGVEPSLSMDLSAIPLGFIPLAFASAIVRYRLMDVEVILKRLLVYTAVLAAITAIYVTIFRTSSGFIIQTEDEHRWLIAFLATVIVVLLAKPVKDAVQAAIDRVFYRDRYDYRRALVAFARDLNGDLDLTRLSERLVSRVKETFLVDRIALMLACESGEFESLRSEGFDHQLPKLVNVSGIGSRLALGQAVRLDDPLAAGRFTVEEVETWRDAGIYYLVPCLSNQTVNAVFAIGRRETGEPLTSEDMNLLSAVAGQAATAIENGRLYRQLHLKASELDRLRTFNENILESLDDGLLVVGLDDRIIRWNQALERLYGVTRADALGQPLDELFAAHFVDTIRTARSTSPSGRSLFRVPLATRRGDVAEKLVNVTMVPLQAVVGAAGHAGTIVILEDVTERARLEEQLRISEKMASLGLLAAGVAHEVNTPLTGISSYTQMLLEQADPADPRTQVLEKIEKQTFRAARIVNGLLTLSRPTAADASEKLPVNLNTVINDVLALLEHQLDKGSIKIRREMVAGPVLIEGYEFKLQQIFLNLLLNARDAMPSGGWLTIATRVEGGEAVAEVADTGSGIQAEHLARIYDPFFTTKATGQGTGLGLSITYGIVREHEGTIHCDSAAGHGTRFTLRFSAAAIQPISAAR
ncbi:MAG TPA: ATP-binding protein [Vicinamibacterales bacterium]|nr:ATP-binding protein [Vicinamibacterales bacterium]